MVVAGLVRSLGEDKSSNPAHRIITLVEAEHRSLTLNAAKFTAPKTNRPKAGSQSDPMIVDQAAINAGFDFRRYAMKPMPAKPRSSIAHVDSSGTSGAL